MGWDRRGGTERVFNMMLVSGRNGVERSESLSNDTGENIADEVVEAEDGKRLLKMNGSKEGAGVLHKGYVSGGVGCVGGGWGKVSDRSSLVLCFFCLKYQATDGLRKLLIKIVIFYVRQLSRQKIYYSLLPPSGCHFPFSAEVVHCFLYCR